MNVSFTLLEFLSKTIPTLQLTSDTGMEYVDIASDSDEPLVSFLPVSKVASVDTESAWTTKYRQNIKFGRFLAKMCPTHPEAERLAATHAFSAFFINSKPKIELVSGQDIKKWYLENNTINKATLGGSCMRYSACQKFLDLYTSNTDVCSMVILRIPAQDKIAARALLWKGMDKTTPVTVLDRIYYASKVYENLMLDWAKNNVDWFRTESRESAVFHNAVGDKLLWSRVHIPLKHWKFWTYPYLDTFPFVDKDKQCLRSNAAASVRTCRQTNGTFSDTDGDMSGDVPDGFVLHHTRTRAIPRDEAVEISNLFYTADEVATCACGKSIVKATALVLGPTYYCNKTHAYASTKQITCCDVIICIGCKAAPADKSGVCPACKPKVYICDTCSIATDVNYSYSDTKILCKACFGKIKTCVKCGERITAEHACTVSVGVCTTCEDTSALVNGMCGVCRLMRNII